MLKPLTIPGKRKAAAFLYVFLFAAGFTLVRALLPLFVSSVAPLDDVPTNVVALVGTALAALFAAQTTAKFSPAVRDGKEPV